MAKKTHHLAGPDAEDSGGLFSNLLAEEEEFDARRMAWRLGSWGVGSVAAVVLAIMANQASENWRRDRAMTADLVQQANRLQAVARESQNDARRLASAIETLNSDRDRLYTRVTVLEQGLDSVTGAIAKQNTLAAAPVVASEAASAAAPSPAPAVAPVAAQPAAQSDKATATTAAEKPPAHTSAVKDVPTKPSTMSATALVESKSMMAPPDPAAGKLIEPAKPAKSNATEPVPAAVTPAPVAPAVAAAPAHEPANADTADAALPKIQRTEFGVDVGGANSVSGLRALWKGLLKSRSNGPLAALQPVIVIREGTGGRGMQLRLVAGPLSDAAAAAKLCAVLSENERDCETTVYEGQRLTFKSDDTPSATAPAAAPVPPAAPPNSRRKSMSQKRAAVQETAKPEQTASSGWTSFFSTKRN